MRQLANRTVILTGATGGIGPHIVKAMAAERTNLVLAARSTEALEEEAEKARQSGVNTIAVPTDVGKRESLEALVQRAEGEFGAIDVIINNAGLDKFWTFDKTKPEDIEDLTQVNLAAPMLLTLLVLPGMLERKRGHILNMSSMGGKMGLPCNEVYCATKAGLIGFTRSFRAEYKGTGVSASVICPGLIRAGIYQRTRAHGAPEAPITLGSSPPEKVAGAVVKAIKKDIPEIVVNPGYLTKRLVPAISEIAPSLAEGMIQLAGLRSWFLKGAQGYEQAAEQHKA